MIFEATDEFSLFPAVTGRRVQHPGIFVIESDGSGLRRLASASRNPPFRLSADASDSSGVLLVADLPFRFSPDGRLVAFTDLGPGPEGETIQVVTLDVVTGKRTQVTRLPPPSFSSRFPGTWRAAFVDNDTIAFVSNFPGMYTIFTVGTDGSDLTAVPTPVAGDSHVVTDFAITGVGSDLLWMLVPGRSENDVPIVGNGIREIFVRDGDDFLQLTNFGRADTYPAFLSADGRRAFFVASANPPSPGTNPSNACQLFSIDTLARHLRQLTHFEGGAIRNGCFTGDPPPGCYITDVRQDPVTRAIVFPSSCDPFGTNPFGGQIFAMRPNGSRLRQVTHTQGMLMKADGSVEVELPGPMACSTSQQQ